ncbi:carboxypeptidase-like regulatory domain-containing protein [Lacinutrix cladophorae]
MKTTYFLSLMISLICVQISWSQNIEIQGKIVSEASDIENITIYNSNSKKGTITNINGAFTIEVKIKDVLEISALTLKKVTVIINEEIIKSRALTILVNEEVNTLDEVVILTHDLTGELLVDVDNAEYFKPIPIDVGTMDNLEFDDIRMDKVDNVIIKKGELYNGFNPVEMLKLFGVKFKKKKKLNYLELKERDEETKQVLDLSDIYSPGFILENFYIPISETEAFYAFVEASPLDHTLLKKENEVVLLEFLLKQSKLFLKSKNGQH